MGKKERRVGPPDGPHHEHYGAHVRNRTGDLTLTKGVLYQLSYMGGNGRIQILCGAGDGNRTHTISLEG
jgi:hypothetical protein